MDDLGANQSKHSGDEGASNKRTLDSLVTDKDNKEAILAYLPTSVQRVREIEQNGLRIGDGTDSFIFDTRPYERERNLYDGAVIVFRIPVDWLQEQEFDVDPRWGRLTIAADIPRLFIIEIQGTK